MVVGVGVVVGAEEAEPDLGCSCRLQKGSHGVSDESRAASFRDPR